MYTNEEHKKVVEGRGYGYIGSYDRKEITIDNKNKSKKHIYIRVKCPYCSSEYDVILRDFKRGFNCGKCCQKYENSFAYFIQQELGEGLSKYWDWEKNIINPYLIRKNFSKHKVWIKCTKTDYHGSYEIRCNDFIRGSRCPYCSHFHGKVHPKDSFGQWLIDTYGNDAIEKYWSDKNIIDPFDITPASSTKVWIKCQEKEYHGDYETTCNYFYRGCRCPYCYNKKVHKLDSFGYLHSEYAKHWSSKNKKSPYEVASYSKRKYWFVCEDCGVEFQVGLNNVANDSRSMKCRNCTSSKGEQKIKEWLVKNNINFESQKKFDGLTGLGNGNLSYDFYLPKQSLLIEYQGEQHEHFVKGFHINKNGFKKQKEHDRRKKEYALEHNIDLLEIWYYDFENIDNILDKVLKHVEDYEYDVI